MLHHESKQKPNGSAAPGLTVDPGGYGLRPYPPTWRFFYESTRCIDNPKNPPFNCANKDVTRYFTRGSESW